MATEKRLIDANKLRTQFDDIPPFMVMTGGCVQQFIDKAPTVDAVEVVRCKECRFCKKHPTSDKVKLCTNENWNTEYHPFAYDDGFCSYGERRTDA